MPPIRISPSDFRFRLLGVIPLGFFLVHWHHHAIEGTALSMLWLCNLNNLLLALGVLLHVPVLYQVGVLWLLPGIPLWMIEAWRDNDFPFSAILSHAGALLFGLLLLKRLGMSRRAWIPALAYAWAVQIASRVFTPTRLNINVSHFIYPGWEQWFSHYWQFWLFIAAEAASCVFLLCMILNRKFPVKGPR